jgi:aspartyl-tRNA(Asn)/glutamyl-tRNA(Gln) amidotransferase subunit B
VGSRDLGLEVHAQVISECQAVLRRADDVRRRSQHAGVTGRRRHARHAARDQRALRGAGRAHGSRPQRQINLRSVFDRKNYFYADLPQGYQISQFKDPIVGEGTVEIDLPDGRTRTIGIERLHLEQDAGKSLHDQHPSQTYVDLNRSGVALMEIVSKPDMRTADEAAAYLSKLRSIVRYLGTCDGNMDEGSMRCDVNVSVRKLGDGLGTRCEIKNVNSVKAVQQAIDYEAKRQIEIIEGGDTIKQETRLWDPAKMETRSMRSKEEAHDYRYFPDPDLLPLELDEAWVQSIKKTLPELPDQKKHRFMKDYGLPLYDATTLIAERSRADYFESAANDRDPKLVANWVLNELLALLNKDNRDITESPVKAEQLGSLVGLISKGTISGKMAKDLFVDMYKGAVLIDLEKYIQEKGLIQVTDTGEIEQVIDKIIAANPDNVAAYRSGKDKLFGFFVGQVMKETGGKANPNIVNDLLKKKLS